MMRKIGTHALILALFLAPFSARAALENPLAFGTLEEFLYALLKIVIQIGFPILVLFIVYIGFLFVQHSAEGSDKLKDDKKYLFWAIVGGLILLGAQALALAIEATVSDLSRGL